MGVRSLIQPVDDGILYGHGFEPESHAHFHGITKYRPRTRLGSARPNHLDLSSERLGASPCMVPVFQLSTYSSIDTVQLSFMFESKYSNSLPL